MDITTKKITTPAKTYNTLPSDEAIESTIESLKQNGIEAELVNTLQEAKEKVLGYIPKNAQVFTSTSKTLEKTGIEEAINNSDQYDSVRNKLNELAGDDSPEADKQRKILGATPDYILGSVHAVTHDGRVLVASGSGSQLPGYTYSAKHVIWVVGTQKIVEDINQAMDRIQTYIMPLEDQRMKEVHGPEAGAHLRKLLIFNKEGNHGRIRLIFVNQNVGF